MTHLFRCNITPLSNLTTSRNTLNSEQTEVDLAMKDIISHHSLCVGWKQNLKLLRGIRKICTIEPCKLMADAMLVWNELWIIWVMVVAPLSFWHEVYQHGIHIICICERIPFCYSTKEKKNNSTANITRRQTIVSALKCFSLFLFSHFYFLFFVHRLIPNLLSSSSL